MKYFNSVFLTVFSFCLFSCSEDDKAIENYPIENNKKIESAFLSQKEAAVIADKFIKTHGILGPQTKSINPKLNMVYTDLTDEITTKSSDSNPAFYVFNISKKGYVIVSGHKATLPILGYSTESSFNSKDIPVNLQDVLGNFKKQINEAKKSNKVISNKVLNVREAILNEKLIRTKSSKDVAPILGGIKWTQRPYYNAYCPKNRPIGCVATATAQIMRHYKYPKSSKGKTSYDNYYGKLKFDYNYKINWNEMPEATLTSPNDEVAKFCYGIAVGLQMDFKPNSGSVARQGNVPKLLRDHYSYPYSVMNIHRRMYDDSRWHEVILDEIKAGRPVLYSGYGKNNSGHAFVCDGYDSNTKFFHFNWGWGGMSNGYFLLDALDPQSIGIGGGYGGYNSNQQAVIGFSPVDPDEAEESGNTDDDTPIVISYCDSKSSNNQYYYIKGVTFGEMKNNSRAKTGYSNYSANARKIIYADPGQKLQFKLSPGFYGNKTKVYWNTWIDFNNDGKFNNNTEKVVQFFGSKERSGYIKIPRNSSNCSYRVRVSMKHNGYSNPCEDFKHGEVQDYTLIVL